MPNDIPKWLTVQEAARRVATASTKGTLAAR